MRSLSVVAGPVHGIRSRSLAVAGLWVLAVLTGGGTAAQAGYDVSGQSSGVAISANLSIVSVASASLSLNALSGTSPSPYSTEMSTNVTTTISQGGFNLPIVGTPETLLSGSVGPLDTTVSSTVTGSSTNATVSASTTINNLNLDVLGSLVTIGDTLLTSSSSVTGTYGSLVPTGSAPVTGLAIDVLGVNVSALLEASLGSLVNIGSVLGLEIGLDVKMTPGDGVSTSEVTTENVLIQFNGVVTVGGVLNGSIVIGQTEASMTASPGAVVPEPSSLAMTAVGLMGAFAFRRKRRRHHITLA